MSDILTDEEVAKVKECELLEAIESGELDCENCTGKCRQIAQAQLDKAKPLIEKAEGKRLTVAFHKAIHYHNGEWSFTPTKFLEFMDALGGSDA